MAVTVTYQFPVAGITAPTATQSFGRNMVNATVAKTADGDTSAVITHNWAISAADLSAGFPIITLTALLAQFYVSAPAATTIATNAVTLTLATTTASGTANPQIQVNIQKPASSIK